MTLYVRETAPQEHPSAEQRFDECGTENLRDIELLMLSLGLSCQQAVPLLESLTLAEFSLLSPAELEEHLDKETAMSFQCSVELARRAFKQGMGILPAISCPAETLPFLTGIKDESKENFLCLYLNARNQVIHSEIISVGSLSASIVHPREVFIVAIKNNGASVILAHNHPSGDPAPSKDDIELTRRLIKAGEILGIEIIDHIIIGKDDFLSLKEKGLM